MHAAIVKFNALPNAVRAATQDHDFFVGGGFCFALVFISGIHVSRVGRELSSASVYPFVNRPNVHGVALSTHFMLGDFQQLGQAAIRETFFLQGTQFVSADRFQAGGFQLKLNLHDVFNLYQEPRVNFGEVENLIHTEAHGKGIAHIPNAVGSWLAQFFFKHFAVLGFFIQTINTHFQTAQGFLEGLLEGAAHGHDLAHRLHLSGEAAVGSREFFESETGNLGDHVIDTGLETGRCGTTGNFVAQLIECVTHSQFGSHLGNRETSGFGRQSRRTRNTWIHLNDHHAAVLRIDRELHVRATRVDANFTQHSQAGVSHDLVFFVGEGLSRRNCDGVAGVHTHRV